MIRILFVSSRAGKISQYISLLSSSRYEFAALADEERVIDNISLAAPDIIILDTISDNINFKNLIKKIKSFSENSAILLLTDKDFNNRDLIKNANAFLQEDFSDEMILNTINMNLRMRESLERLSNTNKDLADSLYVSSKIP